MQRTAKIELTMEQIDLIVDAVMAVDAEMLYGPGKYEDTTGFYDSKDYQLEMIARLLTSHMS